MGYLKHIFSAELFNVNKSSNLLCWLLKWNRNLKIKYPKLEYTVTIFWVESGLWLQENSKTKILSLGMLRDYFKNVQQTIT